MEHLTAITQDEANSLRKKEVASKYPWTFRGLVHPFKSYMNSQVKVFILMLAVPKRVHCTRCIIDHVKKRKD